MKFNFYLLKVFIFPALFAFAGCQSSADQDGEEQQGLTISVDSLDSEVPVTDSEAFPQAMATLTPANGSELEGLATFKDFGEGKVTLKISVSNISPGEHAVHLHENGDCTADDASSAGGHWSPEGSPHGKRNVDMEHHKGDLDNIIVGDNGEGILTMTVLGWSVGGADSTNILNKAVVIHERPDDFSTQPSGDAGDPIGCGVIIGVE